MKRAEVEPQIVQEWLKRPDNERTENDVLKFYGYLCSNRPELLSFRASGDKYQTLMSILRHHIER
ncbi:hypothetical protein [Chlorobaculum parvum]|uniref:hypothetical protein n=1 Tax=Chlorobaculum parvum TaxID=274539 RepID=UPI0012EAF0F5|nr:hypothetical protein [Chlorobaculum parvum]